MYRCVNPHKGKHRKFNDQTSQSSRFVTNTVWNFNSNIYAWFKMFGKAFLRHKEKGTPFSLTRSSVTAKHLV